MQILMPYGLNSHDDATTNESYWERETRIKMVQWHIVLKLCSRFSMASHLNYVVDWFSKLVSSISSSAVRGSDAIRRYHSWKIEARLTLIGSTVIFHCHSSRRKKDLTKKTFGTITICHLLLMMIVCNEAGIFDQLWKLLFGDDLIRKKAFHWYAKEVDMENEVCMLNCFIQDHD